MNTFRFDGYHKCEDNLYRRVVTFNTKSKSVVLVRNNQGKLFHTEHTTRNTKWKSS